MIYFVIYVVLVCMGMGFHLAKHGQRKEGNYSFWVSIISTAIAIWLQYMWGAYDTLFGTTP